jgi:hypothetical protein
MAVISTFLGERQGRATRRRCRAAPNATTAVKLGDTPASTLRTHPAERLVDAITLPIGRWDIQARLCCAATSPMPVGRVGQATNWSVAR